MVFVFMSIWAFVSMSFGCLYLCLHDICVYDYIGLCVYVSLGVSVYVYIVFKKRSRRLYHYVGSSQKWAYQGPGGILLFMLLDF